ncbi:MAG: NUDIX domain-containing protein [Candidatus Paceibacterota bacterium]|jgi:isopentenyldiphosphate isomerase
MSSERKLNIVDEKGNIVGEETRDNIHKKGLLHREIHVWFYTSKGEIIFQHRAKDKDTYPDLLDATVGGHVEIGDDYKNTALKEIEEETGIKVEKNNLSFIQMMRSESYDQITGMTNNVVRAVYAFRYDDQIENLKIEKGKSIGFEAWSFEKLFNISENDKKYFIPAIFKKEILAIFREIQKLIK